MSCDACERGDKLASLKCQCGGKIVFGGEVITTSPGINCCRCKKCKLSFHICETRYDAMKLGKPVEPVKPVRVEASQTPMKIITIEIWGLRYTPLD